MKREEPYEPSPIRSPHTVRIAATLFAVGLALGGGLIGLGATASPSKPAVDGTSATTTAPSAAAPSSASTAPASHAGVDMGAETSPVAARTEVAETPAARTVPYGAEPLSFTKDGNVKVFRLTAAPVAWRTDDSHTMDAWAYNGQLPGPVIRARVGDRIRIVVTNHLPEPTTIHWHGVALPISQDGVPGISQKPIAVGKRFTYEFTLKAPGLAMYHPHFNTLKQ